MLYVFDLQTAVPVELLVFLGYLESSITLELDSTLPANTMAAPKLP